VPFVASNHQQPINKKHTRSRMHESDVHRDGNKSTDDVHLACIRTSAVVDDYPATLV